MEIELFFRQDFPCEMCGVQGKLDFPGNDNDVLVEQENCFRMAFYDFSFQKLEGKQHK